MHVNRELEKSLVERETSHEVVLLHRTTTVQLEDYHDLIGSLWCRGYRA